MSKNLMAVRTIQGPQGPQGPAGPAGPSNIILEKNDPVMYYTTGQNLNYFTNVPSNQELYINNTTPNSGTTLTTILCTEHVSVIGNCETSFNYIAYSNVDDIEPQNPNQQIPPYNPFSYYYQINRNQFRFSCFSDWRWNLDMTKIDKHFKNIYINPQNKIVAIYQYSKPGQIASNGWSYRNCNDIFIRLPFIDDCIVGEEFNFYICKKVRNVYDKNEFGVCDDNQIDCDCQDTSVPPSSYKALLHQFSVGIFIFASEQTSLDTSYITNSDTMEDAIMTGPRVFNYNNMHYYLSLDNETYPDVNSNTNYCKTFSLNPNAMFDFSSVQIKVVWANNKKRFLVTTPLPHFTDNYQTNITMLSVGCTTSQDGVGNGVRI